MLRPSAKVSPSRGGGCLARIELGPMPLVWASIHSARECEQSTDAVQLDLASEEISWFWYVWRSCIYLGSACFCIGEHGSLQTSNAWMWLSSIPWFVFLKTAPFARAFYHDWWLSSMEKIFKSFVNCYYFRKAKSLWILCIVLLFVCNLKVSSELAWTKHANSSSRCKEEEEMEKLSRPLILYSSAMVNSTVISQGQSFKMRVIQRLWEIALNLNENQLSYLATDAPTGLRSLGAD